MPINYWAIIKKSFHLTARHPELWLLGLFLSGGFNTNLIYWANLRLSWRQQGQSLASWLHSHVQAGEHWLLATAAVLIATAVIVLITNWAKTAFILYTSDILQMPRMREGSPQLHPALGRSFREGRRFLLSVVGLSLFTMAIMTILTTILGGAPKFLFASRGTVWLLAGIIFLAAVFIFSCLNIFGTFFVIFYRQNFLKALTLARDLIVSRWQNIVEMTVLLMVIYGLCFFAGSSLLFWGPPTILGGLVLWLWLAIVNTFFNVCLLLLFGQLVKPPEQPELVPAPAEVVRPVTEGASFAVDKISSS